MMNMSRVVINFYKIFFVFIFYLFFSFADAQCIEIPDGYYIECTEEFIIVIPGNFMPTQTGSWRYTSVSEQVNSINNQYKIPVLNYDFNSWTFKNDLHVESMTSYRRSKFTRISDGYWFVNVTKGSHGVAIEKGIANDSANHIYLHDRDWGERCGAIEISEPLMHQNLGANIDNCM